MARYLLDTNHLSDSLKPVSTVRERIYQMHRAGHRIGTCVPVLCELEAGIELLKRREQVRNLLGRLFSEIRLWPIQRSTARIFGVIFHELRNAGRALSQVDMMIAALAREMDLTLVTADQDFGALDDIQVENWL